MSEYWKRHYLESSKQFAGSLLKQVGKTVNGNEVTENQVQLIVDNIQHVLNLNAADTVLDLCCGNGLLTRRYAPLVKRIVAVDYTPGFIEMALQVNHYENIDYVNADVLKLGPQYRRGVNKVIMYEALQHLTLEGFRSLLGELRDLGEGTRFFIASIPDRTKLKMYYDTEDKFAFYMRREAEGAPHIGRWWVFEEIDRISSLNGFEAHKLQQAPSLYTAYYRFDVILKKQSCEK